MESLRKWAFHGTWKHSLKSLLAADKTVYKPEAVARLGPINMEQAWQAGGVHSSQTATDSAHWIELRRVTVDGLRKCISNSHSAGPTRSHQHQLLRCFPPSALGQPLPLPGPRLLSHSQLSFLPFTASSNVLASVGPATPCSVSTLF